MTTLKVTSPSTTRAVATWPIAKLAAPTISSMMFIGLASCPRATSQRLGGGSVGSSLGPYSASRRVTSSASSPRSGLTPSRSAAASAGIAYQETGSRGGLDDGHLSSPGSWSGTSRDVLVTVERWCHALVAPGRLAGSASSRRRGATLSSRMASSVTTEAGSWMRVVNTKVTSTTPAEAMASDRTAALAPVSARTRKCAAVMNVKISRATALPIEAIASRLKNDGQHHARRRLDQQPGRRPPAEPARHERRELPRLRQSLGQPGRRVQPGVGGAGGGEQRR